MRKSTRRRSKTVIKNTRSWISTVKKEQLKNQEIIKEIKKWYELVSAVVCSYPNITFEKWGI